MKPFATGINVFSKAIYLLHLQHQIRVSEHILAVVNWTCCAENIVLIKRARLLTILMCLNPPQLAAVLTLILGCNVFEFFCTTATLLSVAAAVTHPPRFFLISLTVFPAAHPEQRQQPALEPFDVPLGRMCWTTTYSDAFFFPTGGSKEERCGRINCERPFLYVSHTIVCLSVEGRPSGQGGWQGKSLCTCSPTQRHRVTTGSDTRINLYRRLCLITWEIKQVRLY